MSTRVPTGTATPVGQDPAGNMSPAEWRRGLNNIGLGLDDGINGIDRTQLSDFAAGRPNATTEAEIARAAAALPDAPAAVNPNDLLSDEQIYAIGDTLAEDTDDYHPNALNAFLSPAYHFRLCMVSDSQFLKAQNSENLMEAFDGLTKVVLAETGVTAGFNIKDVRLRQLVGMSDPNTRRNGTTGYTLTISETSGTSFMERIRNAAVKLRVKNPHECPYFLELSFKGYDENGTEMTNLLVDQDFGAGGRWIYAMQFTNVDVIFDQGGSEYVIEAMPFSAIDDGGKNNELALIADAITISGRTVGEMLESLKTQMNKVVAQRNGFDLITYDFKLHPIKGSEDKDPATFSMVYTDPELNSSAAATMGPEGMPTLQISPGAHIEATITTIFANSAYAQELAKNLPQTGEAESGSSDSSVASKLSDANIFFKAEPVVVNGDYEYSSQRYRKEVTFHIHPFVTDTPILSRQQVENAKDPAVQRDIIQRWRDTGTLRKRYDYYYTGKNTEVINFDTKYNFKWSATIPLVYGHRLTNESVTTHARFNEDVNTSRDHFENVRKLHADIAEASKREIEAQEELSKIEDRSSQEYTDQRNVLTGIMNERTALVNQRTAANLEANQSRVAAGPTAEEQDIPAGQTFYAEDLGDPDEEDAMFAITFVQSDTRDREGGAATAPYHRDRGLFGALLDQIYDAGAGGGRATISMEIRGDPFWLGQSDFQRRQANAGTSGATETTLGSASYHDRENHILLNTAFPYTINDDGTLEMRSTENGGRKDVFEGFYTITGVEHIFEGGQFRQIISGLRFQLIQVINILGFKSERQEYYDSLMAENAPGAVAGASVTAGAGASGAAIVSAPDTPASKANDMRVVYDQLRVRGYTHEGAKTMVAQIGRENSWNRHLLFGGHSDPANEAHNAGLISWQGDRGSALRSFMRSKGFLNANGSFVQSDASLRAQVDFMHQELSTTAQYRPAYNAMRNGTTYAGIEAIVGDNYIAWRRGDPVYRADGYRNQNAFYAQISNIVGR